MNPVTDLAARAVSFVTLIQDTFLKGSAAIGQDAKMLLHDIFCARFPENLSEHVERQKATALQHQTGPTNFQKRAVELVWISAEDPDGQKVEAYTMQLSTGLAGWICSHKATIFDKLKACGTLPTPFGWREAISHVLYTHTSECLRLAKILQYLPIQVILALGGGTYGARQQRMLQLWHTAGPDEGPSLLTPEFLLTPKERAERDKLRQETGIDLKQQEIATILGNDQALIERLKKDVPLSFELVFRAELEEIKTSRQERYKEHCQVSAVRRPEEEKGTKAWAERQKNMASADPFATAKAMELYALAFSGGGIRSATFNLGILQGLARRGLIGQFDYLSTVSGGGYIGSWLAAWIKRDGSVTKVTDRLNPDKSPDPFGEEVLPIRWLRMFSNYFAPNASIMSVDAWTVGVTWLRNTLLNQIIILLLFLSALLSIRVCFEVWVHHRLWTQTVSGVWLYVAGTVILLTAALLAGLGMQAYHSERLSPLPIKREKTAGITGIIAAITFLGAFAVSASFFSQTGSSHPQRPFSVASYADKLGHLAPAFVLILLALLIVAVLGRYTSCIVAYGKTAARAWCMVALTAIASAGIATLCLALGWELMYDIRYIADAKAVAENALTVAKLHHLQALIAQKEAAIQRGLITAQDFAAMKALIAQKGIAALDELNLIKAFSALKELSAGKELAALKELAVVKPGFGSTFYNGLAFTIGIPVVLLAFGITVVVRMALLGRYFPDERREWWGRMGGSINRSAFIFILIAGSSLLGMELAKMAISSSHSWWTGPVTVGGWMALVGSTVKAAFSGKTSGKGNDKGSGTSATLLNILSKTGPYLFVLGLLIFLPALLIPLFKLFKHPLFHYPAIDGNLLLKTFLLALATAIPAYFLARRVGVNEFSMHHFYRNRLVRAYLGATRRRTERARTSNPFTNFDMQDDVKLADLKNEHGYYGPYPILNTALNASEASSLDRQDRKAESFTFSPLYCGFDFSMTRDSADATCKTYDYGYRPTELFAYANDRGPGIGTAMAISGAAVNPNQGYHSSAATAFLLTVFNVQMGWWIGNPRKNKWSLADPESGLGYIIANLMGKTSTRENFVCLSDGGHFDNMGLYELVRRRCTFIVLGDSEQDNRFTCEGLANAIRRCRIDFGAELEIDVAEITNRDDNNISKKSYALGKIWYAGDEEPTGVLLYIKSSITGKGDEPVDVREYALKHDTFPHQTTGDQFFDEEQFESYRQLGLHIADTALLDPDVIKALCLTPPQQGPTVVSKRILHKGENRSVSFFKKIKLFLGWE